VRENVKIQLRDGGPNEAEVLKSERGKFSGKNNFR
jgi:hypothetical protein